MFGPAGPAVGPVEEDQAVVLSGADRSGFLDGSELRCYHFAIECEDWNSPAVSSFAAVDRLPVDIRLVECSLAAGRSVVDIPLVAASVAAYVAASVAASVAPVAPGTGDFLNPVF